jgi:hypothetical protein
VCRHSLAHPQSRAEQSRAEGGGRSEANRIAWRGRPFLSFRGNRVECSLPDAIGSF